MGLGETITIATRKSPLAMVQTELIIEYLKPLMPGKRFEIMGVVTTGDKQKDWSLAKEGGKGLFTKEIEEVLLAGKADIGMHSAKDLPTLMHGDLEIAGFLPREDARDVFIYREGVVEVKKMASGSPRRMAQGKIFLGEDVEWVEFRGNVMTRMEKLANGYADGTFMASAGLKRLGISGYEGMIFKHLSFEEMVPAVGQGAVALQVRKELVQEFRELLNEDSAYAVGVERTFLKAFGGGCQVAHAAHYENGVLHVFHPNCGIVRFDFKGVAVKDVEEAITEIIKEIKR